uniref:non-specific serine/threonine protein kinase n=1 Tax=Kalanchoe fedtschenkoi TaxID=63787 RepID=A0A7N0TDZ6_KALFE
MVTRTLLPSSSRSHHVLASLALALVFCFSSFGHGATLPPAEVTTLRKIASSLGKADWNFSVDPCSGLSGWNVNPNDMVNCSCAFSNNTVCHVTNILLKSQSLPGFLPPELADLPYIQEIDLSRNYLNGTIPPEWGSTNLVNISLIGNRLSGSIPKEIGNISTLSSLVLEINQLSGPLPPELGNLPSIQRMLLTSNNFTGEIPATFAKLTTLKDFRLGDSFFSGQIPNFIQNWILLEKIVLQGSGLAGPIPSNISLLVKITDLRITDLNGTEGAFPSLENMNGLRTLILRSCNIVGELPGYLGSITSLKVLDLSFNKLSGVIPESFSSLSKSDYIYLTGNSLNGSVPDWMLKSGNVDISYNNFALWNTTSSCQNQRVNIFGNSLVGHTIGTTPCSRNAHCPNKFGSFHINSGGNAYNNGSFAYERDIDKAGPSSYYLSPTNWAISNTGHFLDDNSDSDPYTITNQSALSTGTSQLDMDARISAISLTYYGFCLENGNYTIDLYFAETMFTGDNTYRSLGRRVFDVYVQGKLELKDFNIAAEAGGNGKGIVKTFVRSVLNGTLEIRFQWAGKGTTAIPDRGVYGPLISAISAVNPNYIPPTSPSTGGLSTGAIIGIVIAILVVLLLLMAFLWWKFCLQQIRMADELRGLDLKTGSFTLRQLKAATNNFDPANKIGEGGFGPVYKGHLADGTIIAVKQLSAKSKQGNREFVNEIGMISALQHPHLVKLYGCCIEGNQLLLIYEYMANNSLARALFADFEDSELHLDWPTRCKICIGVARGLAYLHEESVLKIVHRDIKATNVLLDTDLTPKISDFGLAKLDEDENTHISTRIAGTFGYMAPEYAMRGYLTDKADVYSFGILALEIVSGRSNTSYRAKDDCFYLLDWVLILKEKGRLMDLIDPKLKGEFNKDEVMTMIQIGLLCTDVAPTARPAMSSVVSMLEGKSIATDLAKSDSGMPTNEPKSGNLYPVGDQEESFVDSQVHTDGPWSSTSASVPDLYPVNPDSDYFQKRV